MKNIFLLLFAGCILMFMSLKEDSGSIFPSEIKLIAGAVLGAFGIYLFIKRQRNAR